MGRGGATSISTDVETSEARIYAKVDELSGQRDVPCIHWRCSTSRKRRLLRQALVCVYEFALFQRLSEFGPREAACRVHLDCLRKRENSFSHRKLHHSFCPQNQTTKSFCVVPVLSVRADPFQQTCVSSSWFIWLNVSACSAQLSEHAGEEAARGAADRRLCALSPRPLPPHGRARAFQGETDRLFLCDPRDSHNADSGKFK